MHFPTGCNGLVEIYLQKSNGVIIFPYKGDYLALDNATESFNTVYYLPSGTKLQTVIGNYDGSNSHNVDVIVTIQRLSVIQPSLT